MIAGTYSDGSGSVAFPTHVVIDAEGKIHTRVTGANGIKALRKALTEITNK